MKSYIINTIILLCCLGNFAQAQTDKNTSKTATQADKVYNNLGYNKAIQMYRDGKLTTEAMEKMADSYRLIHDTQNAEKWYAQVIDATTNPLTYLYYAQALHSNGKLAEAKNYYLQYDKTVGGTQDMRGQHLADAIDRMLEFQSEMEVEVKNATGINSMKLDFSPAFYGSGLVFVSNQKAEKGGRKKDNWTGDHYNTLFIAQKNDFGNVANPEVFEINLTKEFHEGPVSFSKSGEQVFMTRNITKKTKTKEYVLKIYTAHKTSGVWGEQSQLDLGDGNSNDAHPSLAADGQELYFASDRDGGFGGMDIYKSTFASGKWTTPENLGPKVNTPGNEVFPMIYDDGTLYFASDGWGGLGGLDMFYVEKEDEFTYGDVENLGAPFNSNKDDFGYILNVTGTEGYFTSAREDGFGKDDIYHFTLPKPQSNKKQPILANICVYDAENNARIEGVKVNVLAEDAEGNFSGIDGEFMISLVPTNNPDEFTLKLKRNDPFGDDAGGGTYFTDKEGKFDMKVRKSQKYVFVATKAGYEETRQEFQWDGTAEFCFPMKPVNCIALNGQVLNIDRSYPIPNATVQFINIYTGDVATVQSNEEGRYSFPCIKCGCDFVITGTKPNFKEGSNIATTTDRDCSGTNLGGDITKNLELIPVYDSAGKIQANYPSERNPDDSYRNPNETTVGIPNTGSLAIPRNADEMMEKGFIIELKDIYYDFDEFYIRHPDANNDLNNLIDFMKRNPNIFVELRAHTDSRGSDEYNRNLAQNRAEAAVEYIVARGIESYRITAKGYGEYQLVNECGDGVDCSEEEHQLNRRTEVKVFKPIQNN